MDNRETLTPSSGDAILKRHLFSEVARNWIKGRGHIGRAYFVRRPSRQSFGSRVAASSGPIPKAPGFAGGYLPSRHGKSHETQSVTVGPSSGGGAEDLKVQDGLTFNALQRRPPNSKSRDPLSPAGKLLALNIGADVSRPICVRAQQVCQCVERPLRELW